MYAKDIITQEDIKKLLEKVMSYMYKLKVCSTLSATDIIVRNALVDAYFKGEISLENILDFWGAVK